MRIQDKIHASCENYFHISSPEVKNPVGKIALSALKGLTYLTGVIPLGVWVAKYLTEGNACVIKTAEKGNASIGKTVENRIFLRYEDKDLPVYSNKSGMRGIGGLDMGSYWKDTKQLVIHPKSYTSIDFFKKNPVTGKFDVPVEKKEQHQGFDDTYALYLNVEPGEVYLLKQLVNRDVRQQFFYRIEKPI